MALNHNMLFTATNAMSGVLLGIRRDIAGMAQEAMHATGTMHGLMVGSLAFGTAVAGAFSLFGLAKQAGDFSYAIAGVGANLNATGAQLERIRAEVSRASIETKYGPQEAADAMLTLGQRFGNVDESVRALLPTLNLATLSFGKLAPAGASDAIADLMSNFTKDVPTAEIAAAKLYVLATRLGVPFQDLGKSIKQVSAAAALTGQSVDTALITVGLVRRSLGATTEASTAARNAMLRLVDPKIQALLAKHGVTVVRTGKDFEDFKDVMLSLAAASERMSQADFAAMVKKAFEIRGLRGVGAELISLQRGLITSTGETVRGAAAMQYLMGEFANAEATFADGNKRIRSEFAHILELTKGSMQELAKELGMPMQSVLAPILDKAYLAFNKWITIIQEIPKAKKEAIAKVVMMSTALATLGGALLVATYGFRMLMGLGSAATGGMISKLGGLFMMSTGTVGKLTSVRQAMAKLLTPTTLLLGTGGGLLPASGTPAGSIIGLGPRPIWEKLREMLHGDKEIGGKKGLLYFLTSPGQWMSALLRGITSVGSGLLRFLLSPLTLITLAVAGIAMAIKHNVGGLGDMFAGTGAKLTLFAKGMFQAFTQGGFSGDVMKKLNEEKNLGLKTMIVNLRVYAARLMEFLRGVGAGFTSAIRSAEPAFAAFRHALLRLGEAFGLVSTRQDAKSALSTWESFGRAGQSVGNLLGGVSEAVVTALTVLVNVLTAVIGLIKEVWPLLSFLGKVTMFAFSMLSIAFGGLANIISGAVTLITGALRLIIGLLTGDWSMAWTGALGVAKGAILLLIDGLGTLGRLFARFVDMLTGVAGFSTDFAGHVRTGADAMRADVTRWFDRQGADVPVVPAVRSVLPSVYPVAPGAGATSSAGAAASIAASAQQISGALSDSRRSRDGAPSIAVADVNLDGEKVGEVVVEHVRNKLALEYG